MFNPSRRSARLRGQVFPSDFTDSYYEDISGEVESVDGVYKELRISTGIKNDIGKELPTIIPFEDILEVTTK